MRIECIEPGDGECFTRDGSKCLSKRRRSGNYMFLQMCVNGRMLYIGLKRGSCFIFILTGKAVRGGSKNLKDSKQTVRQIKKVMNVLMT